MNTSETRQSVNWSLGQGARGIERLEARLCDWGFSLHRQDTYGIGITLSGVQTFRYRGTQRYCRAGQCHILHPDEIHDGSAATDAGASYRIVYIDTSLVQRALRGRTLPFVPDPIVDLTSAQRRVLSQLWDMNEEIDALAEADIATAAAEVLVTAAGLTEPASSRSVPINALQRVRDQLAADPTTSKRAEELERIAGLDRWTLARDFRAAFGTSPRRFRTMRQLDHVRQSVKNGASLADVAFAAGFADQSHMSRMFKRAYGITPRHWAQATRSFGTSGAKSRSAHAVPVV
jgi:AraC-like DNA-binding protein